MKTCIAYFSEVGNTKIAVDHLAGKLGADTVELDDKTSYKGLIGFLKGGFSASTRKKAKLDPTVYMKISGYDRIVLATPIWAGKTTPAINAVLENVDFEGKEVYVMVTQADPSFKGSEERKAFYKEMIEAKNGKLIEYFPINGSSPGKLVKDKSFITKQVDERVVIPVGEES